jgi:predicted DsbA family dithiol-disulfide isomerase
MQAVLWRDYLCPWCYLGRSRTAVMRELGVEVHPRSYDLHPEVPIGGRAIRPGGRYDRVLTRIAEECAAEAMPFRKPSRTPNTRRALEIAEIVRLESRDAYEQYDEACYRTQWVEGGTSAIPMFSGRWSRRPASSPTRSTVRSTRGGEASSSTKRWRTLANKG